MAKGDVQFLKNFFRDVWQNDTTHEFILNKDGTDELLKYYHKKGSTNIDKTY